MAMANELLDTNILIDFLRNRPEAIDYFTQISLPSISAITVAELFAGVRGSEEAILKDFINVLNVIDVDSEIAEKGGLYRRDYGRSHGVDLNDAMIAATAEVKSKTLVTLNKKHFPMISKVTVPYRKA